MTIVVKATVTDNKDPQKLGRIKFKSPQLLSGKEHPNWAEPDFPALGSGWGIVFIPEIGQLVDIQFDPLNPDNPTYQGCSVAKSSNLPQEIMDDYPNKAIIKFYDMGYILFEKKDKRITVNCAGDIKLVSPTEVYAEVPLFEIGKQGLSEDDGVVRKSDLQTAINGIEDSVNQLFAKCQSGGGVGSVSHTTAQASKVGRCEK